MAILLLPIKRLSRRRLVGFIGNVGQFRKPAKRVADKLCQLLTVLIGEVHARKFVEVERPSVEQELNDLFGLNRTMP